MRLEPAASASIETVREELQRAGLSTSTLNFIVWVDDLNRREWVLERAEMLGEKHPSFTLIFDKTGTQGGCADVETSSIEDNDALLSVRGRRLTIDAECLTAAEVDEYIATFCPPSVPTVVWWSGASIDHNEIFATLARHANALVVDSSGSVADESTVRDLVGFAQEHPQIALRDLAWMRLAPWRDMIAQFFDDPRLLEELYAIRGLHITSGSDAEALYLGGWLASRLGWRASGPGAFLDGAGKEISFARNREGQVRRVRSVCLDSDSSWYHGEVTDDPNVVVVWVEGEHARDRRLFPLKAIDNASLLERAILEPGADQLFTGTLRTIGTLLS